MLSNENKNANIQTVRVSHGKFRERTSVYNGGEPVGKDQNGNNQYENTYNALTGELKTIFQSNNEFGRQIGFKFESEYGVFYMFGSENSRYIFDLLNRLPNCNLAEPLTIKPVDIEEEQKTAKMLVAYQPEKASRYFSRQKVEELKLPAVQTVNGYDFTGRFNCMLFYAMLQCYRVNATPELGNEVKELHDYIQYNYPAVIKPILNDTGINESELTQLAINYSLRKSDGESDNADKESDLPF